MKLLVALFAMLAGASAFNVGVKAMPAATVAMRTPCTPHAAAALSAI